MSVRLGMAVYWITALIFSTLLGFMFRYLFLLKGASNADANYAAIGLFGVVMLCYGMGHKTIAGIVEDLQNDPASKPQDGSE